jgi:AhpD family alkylhydroperoxidase
MGKFVEKTNEIMKFFGTLSKEKGEVAKGFMAMHQSMEENSALTAKEKEFVALGIAISDRCEGCIAAHVGALLELGVTKEEIMDVISVAIVMGGGPSITYGGIAFQAFEEMSK